MNKSTIVRSSLVAALALAATGAGAAGFRAAPLADFKEGSWSFGLDAGTTFVGGKVKEHVLAPKTTAAEIQALTDEEEIEYARVIYGDKPGRRHQVSRLDWELSAEMAGISGSARNGRLSLNLGVWYGCSSDDDLDMDDYDWMNGDDVKISHHSYSEVEIHDAWMFDANVSYDVIQSEGFTGNAFVGFRQQRWKWTQRGFSEYWYPEDEGGHFTDNGHGIDYRQVVNMAYVGAGGVWKLADSLNLSAYASWAPRYAGRDRDNHISAEKDFHASFDWDDGNVYAAGVALEWLVSQQASITIAADWQKATLHEGDLSCYEYDTQESDTNEDSAGIESEYVALSFGVKYAF